METIKMFSNRYADRYVQVLEFPGYDGGEGADDAPKLDDATKKFIADTVAGAVSGLKSQDLPKLVGETVKSQLAPVNENMTKMNEAIQSFITNSQAAADDKIKGHDDKNKGKDLPPEVNARLRSLDDTVKNQGNTIALLQKQKEDADKHVEETDRHSKIREALIEIPFADTRAAQTAFLIVAPGIKRMDDGTLIGGDNLPVKTYVEDLINKEHKYLLKSTGSVGSGATGGYATSGNRGGGRPDVNEIKTGMPAERRSAVVEDIQAALAGMGSNGR